MKKFKIVFIGAEESGKTTFINYIKEELEKEGKKVSILLMGWKNFINPFLRIFSKMYLKNKKGSASRRIIEHKKRSFLFFMIYYSELWLRYMKALLSKNNIILIDRYFYDELAFANGIKFKIFKLITPEPDLCIIMVAPVSVMRKRGLLVNKKDFYGFYERLKRVAKLGNLIYINSSKNLKNNYFILRNAISKFI